ncbi:MAG: ribonuclease Y [Chloroflexi bacterium RBG_16_68_14]|nr:MAG: ribonuclease Y [Chloroflexi bacterium RBG_16_68_14]
MPAIVLSVVIGVLALAIGGVLGYTLKIRIGQGQVEAAKGTATRILTEAEAKRRETLLEAKEEAIRLRSQAEAELKGRRDETLRLEQRVAAKEENLDRKIEAQERREHELANRQQQVEEQKGQLEELRQRQLREIERVARLSAEEARDLLLKEIDKEVREDAARRIRLIEAEMKEKADQRSREILATAMQRLATDVVSETTVSVVPIPSDEMKGRIIGREGRNIRALEAATGVDLIIDDTPDAVALASFDPVRREIARVALSRLVMDGRIHPTRVEEMVQKARQEVEETIQRAGEEASIEAKCPGLHPEILKIFGRLKYRTSYGQNQLMHAVESAHIAGMIAAEIGADVNVCRRGALLHDLGKAIDHEVEGTHALLGGELARRYKVSPAVVNCIESHHDEVEPQSVEAIVVQIADAISGSRPGARQETLEYYIKRLEALEAVANSFEGVEKAFAIQAGREIRVIVKPEAIDDLEAVRLAREVSKKIEETLEYPGQIKVTVVRETRATEYAR